MTTKNNNLALYDTGLSLDNLKEFVFSTPEVNKQGQDQYFILNLDFMVFVHSIAVLESILFLEIDKLPTDEDRTTANFPVSSVTIAQMRNFIESEEWETLKKGSTVYAIHTILFKSIGNHFIKNTYLSSSN